MKVRPLSLELQEKAKNELGEDPKRLEDGVAHLKEWIAKQPHLNARTDDQWLVAFLRGCKFSLERAKEKIDLYYSLRTTAPELYHPSYPDPRFIELYKLGITLPLPKKISETSPMVVLMRIGKLDPNKYKLAESMAAGFARQQLMQLNSDQMIVCGAIAILDMEGVSMAHLAQVSPTLMKKMVVAGQDASPIRMKGTHYLNTPPGFETIFNLMKGFLNEKNKSRLFVHNKNYEALYKHVPKEILPAEYGGDGGTLEEIQNEWMEKLEEFGPWLIEDKNFGTDESKRPGKPKTAEDMFGIEGSFRQLNVD